MKREDIEKIIHWKIIISLVGILNVSAMLPQLIKIIRHRTVESLAIEMFLIYFIVQIGLSADAFFRRNLPILICMIVSATISAAIIISILILR
jgi:uncharacterized protein with PQ loop repeat